LLGREAQGRADRQTEQEKRDERLQWTAPTWCAPAML
jgi:hypothetical protein